MTPRSGRPRRFPLVTAPVVLLLWGLVHSAGPAHANDTGTCELLLPTSETAPSRDCVACHAREAHGGHAYDVDYPRGGSTLGMVLRPLNEVRRRGVPVPEGRITCTTCHDRTSPWKFHLRVPPGAPVTHAVDVRRASTYEEGIRPRPRPLPGDDVGRKPLCLACHALD